MAFLAQLWLPIVVSAVLVFVVSAATHMLIPARQTEWGHLPKEAALQEALRGARPGLYGFPDAGRRLRARPGRRPCSAGPRGRRAGSRWCRRVPSTWGATSASRCW